MLHSGRSHPDRRAFIGGSDARIIMGDDEADPWFGYGAKSAARSSPKTSRTT